MLQPPTGGHLLGTDDLGRDLLSRLIVGARPLLLAVLQSLAVGVGFGVPIGLLAVLLPALPGGLLMRIVDG
ncbi:MULTISPECIES: hypothetical protein [unclassified Solwaraspora]|uniref:hypothetical protein n=1 Tax=unclassified Solwaraspora TaxID=2627926 RepID=UPI00248BD320|nr:MULTISPECIES: hypothetical protein [unclassified Solwaraspora]WBB99639.1 hypothetical protein O7553_12520 [Solwaraspora sp. WMMA2059]WBC21811.1 hypothetical protein O7543_04850 [Solwaraspora sp. WMMA2080]WJK36142.1 hypothetical protein O7610_07265 [Solwaraspora sp. WMMA2065]